MVCHGWDTEVPLGASGSAPSPTLGLKLKDLIGSKNPISDAWLLGWVVQILQHAFSIHKNMTFISFQTTFMIL
jgi:hypothetical protein